ncbi:YeeE/YedE family protein [Methylocystis heyeri]|uniref:YeeE/YedE family protein n=1 Tax=Methylocystis heyeri TaxID=391905 RepID=A0A6B8KGF5_9HYPH|nr:YeeE/YedE family protein [Methylocystis heyeri]QGM47426.1 YeeE/YedE family protein [Methylocystis heyeri]
MQIDWLHFSPWSALSGGALIGLAAGLCALLLGRVAGVSGILAGLIPPRPGDVAWRAAFIAGLLAAPAAFAMVHPLARPEFGSGPATLAVAGLLVGFGARLGSGCTSGHGVCGLSRLSLRSAVATATFMATAIVTVFLVRHVFQ